MREELDVKPTNRSLAQKEKSPQPPMLRDL
jgi:hypothetical protein